MFFIRLLTIMALIVSMLDGDALDHVFAHIGTDYRTHIAIWLTCKAFGERRPQGELETSANAMCGSPSLFKWAMKIGLQPHHLQLNRLTGAGATVLLNTIRPKMGAKSVSCTGQESAQMVRFGSAIEQLRGHRERRVKANAIKTAVALLQHMTKLEPVALMDPASLDAFIEFIWQSTTGRPCKAMYTDASMALSAILLHLGEMDAHADFGRVMERMLRHPMSFVRYDVLDAINQLDTEGLNHHAAAIADFLRVASCNTDMETAVSILGQLEPDVLGRYSTQVVDLLFRVTEVGTPQAMRLLRRLEPSAITLHVETFVQKIGSHSWVARMAAVTALGDMCQPALAEHTNSVRRLLRDPVCMVRCRAVETMGKLPTADALSHISEIAAMLCDPHCHVRSAAADVLGMFDSVAIAPHVGLISTLLDDGDSWTRFSAMTTLRKLPAVQTEKYTKAMERLPSLMCKCAACSCDRFIKAVLEL